MNNKKIILVSFIFVFILFIYGCTGSGKNNFGPYGSAHDHADFKVYVLGNSLNFNSPQYQVMDRLTHVEGNDGDVLHTHTTSMTLGFFLKTLGLELTQECIELDTGNTYCNKGNAKLQVFLKSIDSDWEELFYSADYVIRDLDKIIVIYGSKDKEGIKKLLDSVSDKAKMY